MNIGFVFFQTENLIHRTDYSSIALFEITDRAFIKMNGRVSELPSFY